MKHRVIFYLLAAALFVAGAWGLIQCQQRRDAETESAALGATREQQQRRIDSLQAAQQNAVRYAQADSLEKRGQKQLATSNQRYRDEILRKPASAWSFDSLRAFLGAD